eukprot:1189-Heterococcus_DN1.PRE.1
MNTFALRRCLPPLARCALQQPAAMRVPASATAVLCLVRGSTAFTGAALRTSAAATRSFHSSRTQLAMVDVKLTQKGETNTQDYRVFFSKDGKDISPWHDIPLKAMHSTAHSTPQSVLAYAAGCRIAICKRLAFCYRASRSHLSNYSLQAIAASPIAELVPVLCACLWALQADGDLYNYVCEIPKNTKAKMEIATKEKLNPIAQDIKKGALRFYHGPIFWNYGAVVATSIVSKYRLLLRTYTVQTCADNCTHELRWYTECFANLVVQGTAVAIARHALAKRSLCRVLQQRATADNSVHVVHAESMQHTLTHSQLGNCNLNACQRVAVAPSAATWEDPNIKHPELGVMGDGDPVDVVEIGSSKHAQGAVKQIRALGALAMIDDGELDWK